CLDACKWCAELVCDGIEQRRAQPLAFLRRTMQGELVHGPRTLNGDSGQAANRLQRLARRIAAADGQGPDCPDTDAQRYVGRPGVLPCELSSRSHRAK